MKKIILAATLCVASVANAGTLLMAGVTSGADKDFDNEIYNMVRETHLDPLKAKYGNKVAVFASIVFSYNASQRFCAVSMVSAAGAGKDDSFKISVNNMPHAQSIKSSANVSEFECGKMLGRVIVDNQQILLNVSKNMFTKGQ